MKFFKSDEWKILWPFYTSFFIYTLMIMFGPYYVIYFQDIGLSFKQISLLMAVFLFTPLVFEIPTGAIADVFGRKSSVILGEFLLAAIFFLIPFFRNFYILLLLFFLLAVSSTLGSGSWDAWIVDLLKRKKRDELIHNFYVKYQSIGSLGVVFMGVISAFFVKYYGIRWTFSVAAVGVIIATLFLFKGEEYFKRQKVNIRNAFKKSIYNSKQSIRYSFKHHALLYFLLASTFAALGFSVAQIMWQPFLRDIGLQPYLLGYVYAALSATAIGIPFLSKSLLKKLKKEKYCFALIKLITIILLLSIVFVHNVLMAVIVILLIVLFDELGMPIAQTFFQRFVPSKIRATTGSLKAMMIGGGAAFGTIMGGIIADKVGPQMTIFYSAFFIIPAVFLYLKIKDSKPSHN